MNAEQLLSVQGTIRDRRLIPQQRHFARFIASGFPRGAIERTPVIVEAGIGQAGPTLPDLLYCFESAGVARASFALIEYSPRHLAMARVVVASILARHPLRRTTSFDVRFLRGDLFARPDRPLAVTGVLRDEGVGPADLIYTSNVISGRDARVAALAALAPAGHRGSVIALGTEWPRPEDGLPMVGYACWAVANVTAKGFVAEPFAYIPLADTASPQHDAILRETFERALAAVA